MPKYNLHVFPAGGRGGVTYRLASGNDADAVVEVASWIADYQRNQPAPDSYQLIKIPDDDSGAITISTTAA